MATGSGRTIVVGKKGFCGPKVGSSTVGGIKVGCGVGACVVTGSDIEGTGIEGDLATSGP